MFTKPLTVSQRKKNKQHKKKLIKKYTKQLCKNETKILSKIEKYMPQDIVKLLYSYINSNVKFNLSHYKELFSKFIYDYNDKTQLSLVFKGFPHFTYCSHENTASPLREMLNKIPLDKLQKYLYFGTPSKYFNIAFPEEPNIQEYIAASYKNNNILTKNEKVIENIRNNYIFEILDLLSYFTTKTNEYYSLHFDDNFLENYKNKYLYQLDLISNVYNYENYHKQSEQFCKENEKISRRIILSILYIFQKYGAKNDD